jgi:hypothetical protein
MLGGSSFGIVPTSAKQAIQLGKLPPQEAVSLLRKLAAVGTTMRELAATIHRSVFSANVADWHSKLKRRQETKAADGGTEEAVEEPLSELRSSGWRARRSLGGLVRVVAKPVRILNHERLLKLANGRGSESGARARKAVSRKANPAP